MSSASWWHGAAIYQIYPRSFADSNGDGIGDLPGITERLDHIARLGVDGIWLSPFFTSPMCDFGYDVSDFEDVDPSFGTLRDFDALVARAQTLGLKVVIDQIYAHSSDQHPWFVESRSSRSNDKADWYVWGDARYDGTPPSNWQSVFGGPAWTWDARRCQYYMHNFLKEQPQFNLHNRAVQDALLGVARFWLERGVSGFRLDALNYAMHDPALSDNPPASPLGARRGRPIFYQRQRHNQGHPDIVGFIERLRAMLDEHDDGFMVAEVGGDDSERLMRDFTRGADRCHTAYNFDFLGAPTLTPAIVAETLGRWSNAPESGWPSWAFENHDASRAISRWAPAGHHAAFLRLKAALLACLRGNIFLYQGEELGLTQVKIAFEDLRDPEAILNWPATMSRDGGRTPMPWQRDAPGLGFSSAKPWLPLGSDHADIAVDRQEGDPESLLAFTRTVLAMRKATPALRHGRLDLRVADDRLLIFDRVHSDQHVTCIFNMSADPLTVDRVDGAVLLSSDEGSDRLPGFGFRLVERG